MCELEFNRRFSFPVLETPSNIDTNFNLKRCKSETKFETRTTSNGRNDEFTKNISLIDKGEVRTQDWAPYMFQKKLLHLATIINSMKEKGLTSGPNKERLDQSLNQVHDELINLSDEYYKETGIMLLTLSSRFNNSEFIGSGSLI